MGRKEIYTKEQIHAMKMNPYTHSVNAYQITFTLEFKEFFVDQIRNHRKNAPQILKAAGYDPSWFTKGCKSSLRRRILEEADSERGLRAPRGLSTAEQIAAFESKNLSKQKTEASIKELQERIVHLEKKVEFLKKTSNIMTNPTLKSQKTVRKLTQSLN